MGRVGLRLSLFGDDFAADLDTLNKPDSGRLEIENPKSAKILAKPTLARPRKGGSGSPRKPGGIASSSAGLKPGRKASMPIQRGSIASKRPRPS